MRDSGGHFAAFEQPEVYVEEIQNCFRKIAVISGVGVRNYYRRFGYKLRDTYMIKNIETVDLRHKAI